MMLASKYEEIYPPEVRDFVYICDNAYTREQAPLPLFQPRPKGVLRSDGGKRGEGWRALPSHTT